MDTLELDNTLSSIFSDFMTKITKLEEMGSLATNFLLGFQQHIELLRRPSLVKTSQVVDNIIKANETERMKAYVQSGCKNVHDAIQSISKCKGDIKFKMLIDLLIVSLFNLFSCGNHLFSCLYHNVPQVNVSQRQLQEHLSKAKDVLDELKLLMENVVACVQTANTSTIQYHICDDSFLQNEEMQLALLKPVVSDYAATVAVVYNMVAQDYSMQENIVTSLNLNSPSEELESYCLMWSLRPFINDQVMHHAWRLIP